jgi:hypothetical protein
MLKYCVFLPLCAGLALSADFITGQAARLVIGQVTFTSQQFGATNTAIGSVGGLAFANNTLFVTDANRLGLLPINHRVLMFGNMSNLPQPTAPIPAFTSRCPVCVGVASNVLGQPNFDPKSVLPSRTATGMNLPLGVASDGVHVAVADTAKNRVLLWNTFPTSLGQAADLVLGQPDFTTIQPVVVTASSLRAPQGVWFQGTKLFVADTQNNRVLIWNSIPTKNNQPADLVLGQPDFSTVPQFDQTKNSFASSSTTMLTPTSVTSDGTHLFVSDLGYSRVLIWNSIPTRNTQAADVVVGQLDMVTAIPNDSAPVGTQPGLCASNGVDSNNNPTYPNLCAKTMSFPRFALSDGKRLFVADGGNDRVLVYNAIPTQNGVAADIILGEPDEFSDVVTSSNASFGGTDLTTSASNVTPTPTSLAWDGTNLYVADPTDFRVLVFTPLEPVIQTTGVVNAASLKTFAQGVITLSGAINPGDTVTLIINGTNYAYTLVSGDTFDTVLTALSDMINKSNNGAGDPNVIARPQLGFQAFFFVARVGGVDGNKVTIATKVNDAAKIVATANTAYLNGGGSVSTVAPGSFISIFGDKLGDTFAQAPAGATNLPLDLGGVQVYIDGIRVPLMMSSPAHDGQQAQINAQVPFEVLDTNSSSLFVRITHNDGSVTVTDAIGLPIVPENPGIFAEQGVDPRPALAYHASSFATGTVTVTGGVSAGDTATVGIEDRLYNYLVQGADTLASIRDALIGLINGNSQEKVTASAAPAYNTIRLQAKVPGPEGNGIAFSATSTGSTSTASGSVILTSTAPTLCCANVAGARITTNNPALAGETVYVLATGLGLVGPNAARDAIVDGGIYQGPASNDPTSPVFALAGGTSANVISAGLQVGAIGIYKVVFELGHDLTSNPAAQVSISQNASTSNVVTFAIYNPSANQ